LQKKIFPTRGRRVPEALMITIVTLIPCVFSDKPPVDVGPFIPSNDNLNSTQPHFWGFFSFCVASAPSNNFFSHPRGNPNSPVFRPPFCYPSLDRIENRRLILMIRLPLRRTNLSLSLLQLFCKRIYTVFLLEAFKYPFTPIQELGLSF